MGDTLTWIGIAFCLSQSAMFSGSNLAFFSLSRLDLEVEAKLDARARRVLGMRQDSNFLLTTILWGNVAINVLLTLLTDSVLTGFLAFFVSTFLITFFGEITPQAYFSRHSLQMASLLAPVLRLYQFVLYPFAKPSARLLDLWLGHETPRYFQEQAFRELLIRHTASHETDLNEVEGRGAANFLDVDDMNAWDEAELLAPASVITLQTDVDLPRFPELTASPSDPFLQLINASGEKWVVITDESGEPRLALDADGFIRGALFSPERFKPYDFCHRPLILRSESRSLAWVIRALARGSKRDEQGVIQDDLVLIWGDTPKIITGADILARLLSGI
jgi:hypothetical protein